MQVLVSKTLCILWKQKQKTQAVVLGRKIRVMNIMLNTFAKCAKLKSINTKSATARLKHWNKWGHCKIWYAFSDNSVTLTSNQQPITITLYSYRRSGLSFQQPHGSSQLFLTLIPRNPMPPRTSSWQVVHGHVCVCRYIYISK